MAAHVRTELLPCRSHSGCHGSGRGLPVARWRCPWLRPRLCHDVDDDVLHHESARFVSAHVRTAPAAARGCHWLAPGLPRVPLEHYPTCALREIHVLVSNSCPLRPYLDSNPLGAITIGRNIVQGGSKIADALHGQFPVGRLRRLRPHRTRHLKRVAAVRLGPRGLRIDPRSRHPAWTYHHLCTTAMPVLPVHVQSLYCTPGMGQAQPSPLQGPRDPSPFLCARNIHRESAPGVCWSAPQRRAEWGSGDFPPCMQMPEMPLCGILGPKSWPWRSVQH